MKLPYKIFHKEKKIYINVYMIHSPPTTRSRSVAPQSNPIPILPPQQGNPQPQPSILPQLPLPQPVNNPVLQPHIPIPQPVHNNPIPQNLIMNESAIMKLTEFLPYFDGNSDVEIFLQKIQLISPQIPAAELPFFLTLLKLKLNGTAAAFMSGEDCPDIDTFSTLLRDRFQLLRKPETYQAQLTQMRQQPKERISDYAARVTKTCTHLNSAFIRETGVPLTPEIQNMNNRQAIKTFIDGLSHPELRTTLRLKDFDTIAEAISLAIETRSRIGSRQEHSQTQHQNPNANRTPIICRHCQKLGHVEKDCRGKAAGRPPVPPQTNPPKTSSNNTNQNSSNYKGNNYNPNYKQPSGQAPNTNPNPNHNPNTNTNQSKAVHAMTTEHEQSGNEQTQELKSLTDSCVKIN